MHPHQKFGIPTSKNIGDMHRTGIGTEGLTDGRTDGRTEGRTVRLLYADQKSFGGIKTVLLKKVELMIAANPVCIYSTSLYKA